MGKPKTLTPGPRTPDTDQVHGLPTDRYTDYPYGAALKQNKKQKWRSHLTASPMDHSFRRNSERYAEKNVTDLGSVSGAILSLYIAISFAVAISMHERPGKLWKASKFVLLWHWLHFIRHFARPILPRVRQLASGFTICLAESQI